MTRVGGDSRTTRVGGDADQTQHNPRMTQLLLIDQRLSRLGRRFRSKDFQFADIVHYRATMPDGRVLPRINLSSEERGPINNFNALIVDRENNEFYVHGYSADYGPLALPDDFKYEDLFFSEHKDPSARGKGYKVLASLSSAAREQEPDIYGKPFVDMDWHLDGRTWRTAEGGKLHNVTPHDERYEFGKQSFMFDLRKKEFWLEQVPGVSGQCKGPYKLPAGFTRKDVDLLKTVDRSEPAPARSTTDSFEPSSRRSSGSGGESVRRSFGGETARPAPRARGGESSRSPSSVYWSYRGGGGGGS